jgi:hypothetical protein
MLPAAGGVGVEILAGGDGGIKVGQVDGGDLRSLLSTGAECGRSEGKTQTFEKMFVHILIQNNIVDSDWLAKIANNRSR